MKSFKKIFLAVMICGCLSLLGLPQALAGGAFDIDKMADMSDFDPNNQVIPTGDVIKIGLLQHFSGAGAGNGELFWAVCGFVAHDINKRGGILVDGKKKKVAFLKGDIKGKPADCKKAAESLVLRDKVDVLWGTSGSHLANIISQVAKKYKVIHHNSLACSDYLMDATNFSPYTFQTFTRNSSMGKAFAYYYAIRQKEKKFYILCQDYSFGHSFAEEFKKALNRFYPEAEIVGEDYHPLFAKDFTPYVTKIKGSDAEVIYTGDWLPDGGNLLNACRDMGCDLPIANIFVDEPNALHKAGVEGTKGLVNINHWMMDLNDPARQKFYKAWNDGWKRWKEPYNTWLYKIPSGTIAECLFSTYWLLDVIERAGSTDPEKIIKVWEGDTYKTLIGTWHMRACDHTNVKDLYISEYVVPEKQKLSMSIPPYYWFKGSCAPGLIVVIPSEICAPYLDPELKKKRCPDL